MKMSVSQTLLFLSVCISFLNITIGDDPEPEPKFEKSPTCNTEMCFVKLQNCKGDKKDASRIYYYDRTTLTCETTDKCGPLMVEDGDEKLFSSKEDCEGQCKPCPEVLKVYKEDDPCIFSDNAHVDDGKKPKAKVATFWKFSVDANACVTMQSEFNQGFKVKKGILFMTEKQCTKKCPSIPK